MELKDELWFIEFGRGQALPLTPEDGPSGGNDFAAAALAAEKARTGRVVHEETRPIILPPTKPRPPLRSYASFDRTDWTYEKHTRETSFIRPPLKFGASLDQGKLQYSDHQPPQRILPKRTEFKRPPLLHSACFDQSIDFEFTGRPPHRSGYRQKPLSAEEPSILIEEETISMFGSSKYLSKSDECCLIDQNSVDSEISNQNPKNNNNNRVLKTQFSIDLAESVSASYERNYKNRANEYFYERAAAGPSSNIDFNECNTNELKTLTTTAMVHNDSMEEDTATTELFTFRPNRLPGISSNQQQQQQRATPKLVKQNRVQRLSSSSLQQVQTKETSLSKLFDKRFGRKNNRLEKSKRLSTSALYDQSPTEILYKSKSGSGRLSSVQLYEKFCSEDFGSLYGNSNTPNEEYIYPNYYYEDPTTSKSEDSVTYFNFYENPLERASVTALYERFCFDHHTGSSSTSRDTTSSSGAIRKQTPPIRDQDNVFTFDTPTHSTNRKSIYSDETPALSRGSETETSFNDDFISSFNDDFYISSIADDNLETLVEDKLDTEEESETTQIIEMPAEQTILSDQYEPCFGVNLQPKRRSIKKIMLPSFKDRSWDLSNLDLRPIDDDGPDSPINFESNNESPLLTSKTYLANIDETNSIENHSNSEKNTPEDSEKLISKSSTEPTSMSSRLSMHKLQPLTMKCVETIDSDDQVTISEPTTKSIDPNSLNSGVIGDDHINRSMLHLSIDPVKVTTNVNIKSTDKSVFFRVGRDKHASAVTVHRKTKCFPL